MKFNQFSFAFISCLTLLSVGQAAQAASFTVLADGLKNPRGIGFGPDGSIYVGETGEGGDGNCQPSPSTMFEPICAGQTGSVTQIAPDGTVSRSIQNFDSLALSTSSEQGAGPQQLQFDNQGNAYLLAGYAGFPGNRDTEINQLFNDLDINLPPDQALIAPPAPPEEVLGTENLAKLFKVDLETEELTEIFDFAEYELLNNVDGGDYISNPYDLEIYDGRAYVVDAGANVIYDMSLDGSDVNAVAPPSQLVENVEFPPGTMVPPSEVPSDDVPGFDPEQLEDQIPDDSPDVRDSSDGFDPTDLPTSLDLQSVPTGADIGPDGKYYFGELTGFPYPEGEARVFRLGDDGQPEVFAEGFTQITDIAFDNDGNLLVLQFADLAQWKESVNGSLAGLPGSIIQVTPDGTQTVLVEEGIFSATGIEVSSNGDLLVVNDGVGLDGQLIQIASDSLVDGGEVPGDVGEGTTVPEPTSVLSLIAFAFFGSTVLKNKRQSEVEKA